MVEDLCLAAQILKGKNKPVDKDDCNTWQPTYFANRLSKKVSGKLSSSRVILGPPACGPCAGLDLGFGRGRSGAVNN